MANLKDLIVNGSARVIGKTYSSEFVGNATSATKLESSAGSDTEPIYFSSGKPAKTGYTFENSISLDATDNDKKLPTTSAVTSYVGGLVDDINDTIGDVETLLANI